MAFSLIETISFRNLEDKKVNIDSSSIFIVGENGQGKTNFLDAVYTLCYGSSFRQGNDSSSARLGDRAWCVKGNNKEGYKCVVSWKDGSKSITENEKTVYDRKTLVERNPAIVFCHEDMEFARGEPERRRFFFDQTASLVSASYIDLLRLYRRALKARNMAFKEKSMDILDVLDLQIAIYGIGLCEERSKMAAVFDQVFAPRFEEVARLGTRISLEYRPSWKNLDSAEEIAKSLGASREKELILGTSLSGPHRDRFVFTDDSGDFSGRASTGQLRLLSLTLRIAQAEYYSASTGRYPTLLLDDVLLELDPDKKQRFMSLLPKHEQAFFTFLPGEPFANYKSPDTLVYWADNGRFLPA
ncbi:DNA replication and repair protein RecF [Spirochaetota bacterium]